ncbi:serpin B [Nocardioides thalensis]|uniref:Serpin B n=1 Tax=Nocardioides thalensis TaxID=1914755 RepID=A0A853BWL6_9ACTN|nr:serpin family protein [Nocardioides thalensis]NYJ00310.1 serpin B [Nocardioides thalensis]
MAQGEVDLAGSDTARSEGDRAAIPGVVAAMHGFAGDLYGELPADGNLVVSPYSVVAALGMTLTGAGGHTAREMRDVLGADDRFHGGLNALTTYVEGLAGPVPHRDGKEIALDTANQLFGQRGVGWEKAFLDTLAREYGAAVRTVDFEGAAEDARVLINDWVAGRTHDRIRDLIARGVLDAATRLVLVNAIYLKAPWEKPFEPSSTRDGTFHLTDGGTTRVPMMSGSPYGALTRGDGWQAARIPYAGGTLAMTVVLPDEGRLADVEQEVVRGGLPQMLAGGRGTTLDLRLPRWTFRSNAQLAGILGSLGMPSAFGSDADFRPMTDEDLDLRIGEVVHQGFVAVDEHGTEAAAATAVVMETTAMPVTVPFHVDRPFLFVIHDVEHGTPLFLGRVTDPGVGAVG